MCLFDFVMVNKENYCAERLWAPNERSVLVVLDVKKEVALECFMKWGRPGMCLREVLRIQEIEDVIEGMGNDGVKVVRVRKGETDAQRVVE